MKLPIAGLSALFALAACGGKAVPANLGGDTLTTETVLVAPYRVPCAGFAGINACLLITDESGEPIAEEAISGFEHEVGFNYRLRVAKTVYAEPPADSNDFDLALEEVFVKEPADRAATFTVGVPTPQTGLYALASGDYYGFQVGSSLNLQATSMELYNEAIAAFGEGAYRVDFTARLQSPPQTTILLLGIECIVYSAEDCQ